MQKKLTYATIIVLLSILLCCIGVKFYSVHTRVNTSSATWERFTGYIEKEEFERAQEMLSVAAMENYISIKAYVMFRQDGLYYYDVNITEKLAKSHCQFWPTFYFYLAEKKLYPYDKVIFDSGYALIDQGRIFFLKIP